MKPLIVLAFLAVGAYSAPTGEQVAEGIQESQDNDLRAKRAQETIMFGNQQNAAKEMKKRDHVDEVDDTVDRSAKVIVNEPTEISETTEDEEVQDDKISETEEGESPKTETEEVETITENENQESDVGGLEDMPEAEDAETTALETIDSDSNIGYQDYLKTLKDKDYMSQYYEMLSKVNPEDYYIPGFQYYNSPYRYRFRRSQNRPFTGGYDARDSRYLKRGHRTKRDLYYPEFLLSQQYYPYEDNYLEKPYGNFQAEEDELSYLLDALDQYEDSDDVDDDDIMDYIKYENSMPYNGYEEEDDSEYGPWYEAPIKRQAALGFVPGIKRSRDFYPAFLEPGTHFQAFVPQKRSLEEYADAYEKVMELAAALRSQYMYPQRYEPEDEYRWK